MYQRFGLLVAGEWRPAAKGASTPVLSPVTEASLGSAPVAGVADTEAALDAAQARCKARRATPAFTRAGSLHSVADEMIRRTSEAAEMISTSSSHEW